MLLSGVVQALVLGAFLVAVGAGDGGGGGGGGGGVGGVGWGVQRMVVVVVVFSLLACVLSPVLRTRPLRAATA